jgi:hypothetical protein
MKDTIKIKYPNEDDYIEVYIDEVLFVRQKIVGNSVFGYCNSDYVSMSIDDYKKLKQR